jgi:hypothetical protein
LRRISPIVMAALLPLSFWIGNNLLAGVAIEQVCNVGADYSLGGEDYSKAIRLHVEVVCKRPKNALAHYHPGSPKRIVGDRTAEVREYQRAEELG